MAKIKKAPPIKEELDEHTPLYKPLYKSFDFWLALVSLIVSIIALTVR